MPRPGRWEDGPPSLHLVAFTATHSLKERVAQRRGCRISCNSLKVNPFEAMFSASGAGYLAHGTAAGISVSILFWKIPACFLTITSLNYKYSSSYSWKAAFLRVPLHSFCPKMHPSSCLQRDLLKKCVTMWPETSIGFLLMNESKI